MHVDDVTRLRHMLDAAKSIEQFTAGKARRNLDTEPLLAHALVRLIEIIGEAAGNISPEYKEKHADIPWRDIVGMRNRLIHGYFEVDFDVVWRTVTSDIPMLIEKLQRILP